MILVMMMIMILVMMMMMMMIQATITTTGTFSISIAITITITNTITIIYCCYYIHSLLLLPFLLQLLGIPTATILILSNDTNQHRQMIMVQLVFLPGPVYRNLKPRDFKSSWARNKTPLVVECFTWVENFGGYTILNMGVILNMGGILFIWEFHTLFLH